MKQTAEEKAKELFNNFIAPTQQWDDVDGYITDEYNAKQCASITVNEIIENLVELFERSKTKKRNNMEQTAVEWLVEQICGDHTDLWQKEIEQAKEMEKEQIEELVIATYTDLKMKDCQLPYGIQYHNELLKALEEAKKYYNETFKQQEQ